MSEDRSRLSHTIELGMFVRESPGPAAPRATLVHVHGLGESGLCFERVMRHRRLADFRQLAADIPGYGRSAWPPEPLSLARHAELLARWIDGRGHGPVVLVGHSMGGVSGLELCERYPDRILHFINVEGNVSLGDCSYSAYACEYDAVEFVDRGFEALLERLYGDGIEDGAHRGYYASMRHCDPRTFYLNSRELVDVSTAETPAGRLAGLSVGVTHVPGVPGGNAPRTIELLKQAGIRIEPVEPAGHWPFHDRLDDYVDVLLAILDRELVSS